MTRQDYIHHLDALRKDVLEIIKFDLERKKRDGGLTAPTDLEQERAEKTQKMLENLAIRLYEDAAISEKVKQEKIQAGEFDQAEITFPDDVVERVADKMVKQAKKKGGAK